MPPPGKETILDFLAGDTATFSAGGERDPATRTWLDPHVLITRLHGLGPERAPTQCLSRTYTKRQFAHEVPAKELVRDPTLEVRTMPCNSPTCNSDQVVLDASDREALRLRYTCLRCQCQWSD